GAGTELDDWYYQVAWDKAERPAVPASSAAGKGAWLIFADDQGVGAALAKQLRDGGQDCALVEPGDSFAQLEKGRFRIHPEDESDYRKLFELAFAKGQSCAGIVHLWGLRMAEPGGATSQSLGQMITLGAGSVLELWRSLSRAGSGPKPKTTVVTRSAVAT